MANDADVLLLLGRIDGKLDEVISTAAEHREDDKRRFTDVYERIGQQAEDINKAKGAKAALLWVATGVSAIVGAAGAYAAKALGMH